MRTLHQCLLDVDLPHLHAIACFWDVELTAGRRAAAAQLAEALAAPQAIALAWDALPADQQQALQALLAAGGQMPLLVFTRAWGEIRSIGPGRMEREQPWRNPTSPAEGLWYRGFIFRAFEQGAEISYEAIFVPAELRAHLPAAATSPTPLILEPVTGPVVEPPIAHKAGDAFLDDACTLLIYLQNEQLRPGPDGDWPARHTARLSRHLRDPDPARLALLNHLVRRLGWLRVTDAGHLRPDPAPTTAWLQSTTQQQRHILAEAWRDDPTWNDLFHVPTLLPEDTGAWHNDPLATRRAFLHHLRACKPGTWHRLDDLTAAIKRVAPDFQRPDGDYTTWYIRDAASGTYLSGFAAWDRVEGALIRYLVAGPLAWLGLTDATPAGVSAGVPVGTPGVFRLTAAGAAFLGTAEAETAAAVAAAADAAPLTLCADFTIRVNPTRRFDRFQLARVAEWVSSPPVGKADGTFIYRLAPSSLAHARQHGIPIARVLAFLEQATGAPVPRPVEAALTRWDARGAEARLEQAALLRISDEALMAQAMAFPAIHRLVREQVGPTTALVHTRDWPRLAVALGEMGLIPDIAPLEDVDAA